MNPMPLAAVEKPQETNVAAAAQSRRRLDSWMNVFTGLGTDRDKRMAGQVALTDRVPYETLVDLYRSDPLAARIVERPAEEMLREWVEVKIADEKDAGEAVENWLDKIGARQAFRQALCWRRAFGGAGIILGINKGKITPEELMRPLNPGDVKSIDHLTVFASRELQAVAYYCDPLAPNFGMPAAYRIVPQVPFAISGQGIVSFGATQAIEQGTASIPWMALPEIHESRILLFDGVIVSRRQRLENWGHGDSVLQRCFEALRDFAQTNAAAWHLVQDFAQGILTIPGLIDALAGDGEETMRKRVEMLDTMRSIARTIVLDGGDPTGAGKEEFKRDVASLTSIPEILDRAAFIVAAAADMPVSLLMGTRLGTGGLGNTADGDSRNWYDHVADMQRMQVEPNLRKLIELGMASSGGPTKGKVFDLWSVFFRPLWQLSEKEQAEVRASMASTDEKMIGQGVLTPDEVRSSRFGGDGYSLETQLDEGTRESFDEVEGSKGACGECGKPCEPGEKCEACGKGTGEAAPRAPGEPLKPGEKPEEKPADPRATASGEVTPGASSNDLQSLALNGTQISGMLAILQAVRDASLPIESGVLALVAAFPFTFTPEKAKAILEPIEVKEPPEPPDPIELAKAQAAGKPPPFGGHPGAPGAPPFGGKPGAKPGTPPPGAKPPPAGGKPPPFGGKG